MNSAMLLLVCAMMGVSMAAIAPLLPSKSVSKTQLIKRPIMNYLLLQLTYLNLVQMGACGLVDKALESRVIKVWGLILTAGYMYKSQINFSFHADSAHPAVMGTWWNEKAKYYNSNKLNYKLACLAESTPLKNLIVHSIAIIHKIYSANSCFVTGWHNMPRFSGKNFTMIQ